MIYSYAIYGDTGTRRDAWSTQAETCVLLPSFQASAKDISSSWEIEERNFQVVIFNYLTIIQKAIQWSVHFPAAPSRKTKDN